MGVQPLQLAVRFRLPQELGDLFQVPSVVVGKQLRELLVASIAARLLIDGLYFNMIEMARNGKMTEGAAVEVTGSPTPPHGMGHTTIPLTDRKR